MSTKIVCTRVCDRCTKAFPGYQISPGQPEPPLAGHSYRMVRSNRDGTNEEVVVNLEDVCPSCTSVVEDLLKRVRLDEPATKAKAASGAKGNDAPAAEGAAAPAPAAAPAAAPVPAASPAALAAAAVAKSKTATPAAQAPAAAAEAPAAPAETPAPAPAAPVLISHGKPVSSPMPSDPSEAREPGSDDDVEEMDVTADSDATPPAPVAAAPAAPAADAASNGAKKPGDKKSPPKAAPSDYPF